MTEESTIQCESCGTIYSDLEEVCPYCGQPQPSLLDDPLYDDTYYDELPPEEQLYPDQDGVLFDEDNALDDFDEPLDEAYLAARDERLPADPFADDDIFAVVGEDDDGPLAISEDEWPEEHEAYDELEEQFDGFDEPDDYDETELDDEIEPGRPLWRRLTIGCLGTLLCIAVFYGGLGLLGAYHGLQERVQLTQAEAETHYQRGQEHLANDSLELAIAEFELALSLNPNLLAAREALREAERIIQSQPTPTSQTRLAAAAAVLATGEEYMAQENWAEAVETLSQVRELDADYESGRVSELIYNASYELGLQLSTPDQLEQAVEAFERALVERPDDTQVISEIAKALLYIQGDSAAQSDRQQAVESFSQLYQEDAAYLDVKQRLFRAYEEYGDELLDQEEWCLAEAQYVEAALLQPDDRLQAKAERSNERCQEAEIAQATGTPPQAQAPPTRAIDTAHSDVAVESTAPITETSSTISAAPGSGSILFSAYNPSETRWEILSVPARGGSPKVLVTDGTMPAMSPNGSLLLYHSELIEAEGFHLFNLTNGQDDRITQLKRHVLPRWGGDDERFLFVAQEPTTGRWQIQLGFADGKSDPLILRDGRTPDWSPDNSLIAYQGTDAEGNNPGLYIVPFEGGEAIRLTNHESDRTPSFSPDGARLAYMSTRSGNWDIFTISTAGSAPRQVTTAPGNDGLPVWSPDGSQIAYVSDADGSWAIYVINADGGVPAKVIEWDGSNRSNWLLTQIWWAR
jgi:tetratricopeptide (TPR) repeat protein